ncbi:MAG: mandelate racemase/muconate lactonizing enzyme family protein [Caldilineaceae bacterium]
MSTSLEQNVNTNSRPTDLKITDMRIAHLAGIPMRAPIIRIETNQGLVGYGEVRDGASKTYALVLKRHLIGENPCNIDKIFRKIKQFGYHARQAGGVCGVEMALFDLAGKAYGVPAYQLAGGKFRDKVLCYCDTPSTPDGTEMGRRLKTRMEQGFKFLKMDVGIQLLRGIPGALIAPPEMLQSRTVMHQFTGIQITDVGIGILCDYVAAVRDEIGYEVPLAVDHFGHIGLKSCIRLGKALDKFTLAWYEDMIPWQYADQWAELTRAVDTPTCTGEDIYLKEGFMPSLKSKGSTSFIPTWLLPVALWRPRRSAISPRIMALPWRCTWPAHRLALANVHCAAATENFLVLENHSVDTPKWNELITGLPNPLIQDGYIQVPEKPGLGFDDINEDLFRENLNPKDAVYFDTPTAEWDDDWSHDRLWS